MFLGSTGERGSLMKISPFVQTALKPNLNEIKKLPSNSTEGKIIFFTGKGPNSKELSEVVDIASKVSKENLQTYLKELAGPETEGRGVGQQGIEKAKEYIAGKFKEFGLQPVKELGLNNYFETFILPQYPVRSQDQYTKMYGYLDHYDPDIKNVPSSNVLGMIKGSEKPDEFLVISGHYDHLGKDTENNIIYPGANDDASGVVTMLEIARILSSGKPPKKSVIFAALTGEESGWLGANNLSKHLIEKNLAKKVEVFNIEMLAANAGNKIELWDQKMPEAKNMVDSIVTAGKALGTNVKVNHKVDPGSDSIRFSSYKIPSVCVIWDFSDNRNRNHPTYHCAQDTPENINPKIFYEAARVAAASGYLMANTEPSQADKLTMLKSKLNIKEQANIQKEIDKALKELKPL